ncbi:hypothetical protein Tco_0727787 [Tanacetum coccineum]|uniref:Uncharacterized protein n=1 Tax=Tanacetum coccineum TaxID=301880 RepID=A0ABQ4YKD9_9ASTR
MEDDSLTDIILDDVYNTFYRDDEEEETEVSKKVRIWHVDKEKGKEAKHDHLKVNKGDKGKGKVHDIQNILEKLEVDLARALKAKQAEHDMGKGKHLDDVDLDDHDDDLDAYDIDLDDLDSLDLENRIKKLEEDFGSDEDDFTDEGLFGDEDVVLFNDVKYPLTDVEIRMFKERPTTSRASTASTSTRSRAPMLPLLMHKMLLLQLKEGGK